MSYVSTEESIIQFGIRALTIESEALAQLAQRIDHTFEDACQLLLNCQGRVVVTGMGKSGHIGKKVSATFSSTGTPSLFMHPAEASHGDMGMITKKRCGLSLIQFWRN